MATVPTSLDSLAACAGRWRGTHRLHDPSTRNWEDSPSTLTVTPVLGGRFVRVEYSWSYQGVPQEGTMHWGAEIDPAVVTLHWADTWHMDRKVMICQGPTGEAQRLSVKGSYAAPPSTDWGWRIELNCLPGTKLELRMFNVTPEGEEALAVEAAYSPAPGSVAVQGTRGTEAGLADIRQIALTARDVGAALPFYRDVLGLKFLFSAGPNLAFLAAGPVRIMLTRPEGSGTPGANSILYFNVENVEAVYDAVVRRGAKAEHAPQLTARMPDHELWIGFVRDPENNLIGLLEEKRPTSGAA